MYTRLLQDLSRQHYVALVLIVALLAWSVVIPTILKADAVSPGPIEFQIVLSDSAPGVTATHTISFKIATGTLVTIGDQVTIEYKEAGASASSTSVDLNFNVDSTAVAGVTVNGSARAWTLDSATGGLVTLNVIGGDLVAQDEVVIVLTGIVNPDHDFAADDPLWATTHVVTASLIDGTDTYSSDTRVAIIDNITMTAAVDTIFEFSVGGILGGEAVNGNNTTGSSTPTSLDFGTISHDNFYYLAQVLTVETNASNGFIVTIQESQELTSSTGEKIHRFADTTSGDVGTAAPATWTQPTATLNDFETYGHYGITTNDATLHERTGVSTDENFTLLELGENGVNGGWVGNFHQEPRPIFGHTDAADGSTANYGTASVGFGIEITSLQAAGNDYTNTLTYVATPTF